MFLSGVETATLTLSERSECLSRACQMYFDMPVLWINVNKTFTCKTFLVMAELSLTLSWESPAAGGLLSQFGSFWKWQGEGNDESLAHRHCHWWHFFPGSWFRQRGGFGRSWRLWRYQICAVHGDGELERDLHFRGARINPIMMSFLCNLCNPNPSSSKAFMISRLMTHVGKMQSAYSRLELCSYTYTHTHVSPGRQSWRPDPALWPGGCWCRPRREACCPHQHRLLQVHWSRTC